MNLSKIFIIILVFFFNINIAFSNEKFAFINIDKVLKNSIYGNSLLKDIQNLNKKNIEKLKNNETNLKKKKKILIRKKI